jgi:hypothetical protein
MGLIWSDVVRTTSLGPAVFEVLPAHRGRVRNWLAGQDLPHAAERDVHSPTVEGWALLDGGITAVSGYGLTSLPHGLRVVGYGALRLVLAGLGVAPPAEPFPDEQVVGLDELRRRYRASLAGSAQVREQAELLAACRDALLLRWVAATLFREARASERPAEERIDAPAVARDEPTVELRAPSGTDSPADPMPLVSAERTPPSGSRL